MTLTTALATMAANISSMQKKDLNLNMVLPPQRVLLNQLALTKTPNAKSILPTNLSSLGIGPSPNRPRRNTIIAVEISLALIMRRLGTSF
jgi:hypothetical protein